MQLDELGKALEAGYPDIPVPPSLLELRYSLDEFIHWAYIA